MNSTRDTTTPAAGARQAQRDRTHRLLLGSARELMLTRGYERTTVIEIAEAVGYTNGALLRYYQRKIDIGHDVADSLTDHTLALLARRRPRDTADLIEVLARWSHLMITSPGWIHLQHDLAAHSDDDRARVQQRAQRIRTALADLLTTTIPPVPDRETLEFTVHTLVSVVIGYATLHSGGVLLDRDQIRTRIHTLLEPLTT